MNRKGGRAIKNKIKKECGHVLLRHVQCDYGHPRSSTHDVFTHLRRSQHSYSVKHWVYEHGSAIAANDLASGNKDKDLSLSARVSSSSLGVKPLEDLTLRVIEPH